MPRVVCDGEVDWDVTLRVETPPEPDGEAQLTSQRRSGGGSAANTAVALANRGVTYGLIGTLATMTGGRGSGAGSKNTA